MGQPTDQLPWEQHTILGRLRMSSRYSSHRLLFFPGRAALHDSQTQLLALHPGPTQAMWYCFCIR